MSVNEHGGREPPTNYIKQMNAFLAQSAGVLGAKEQAVYLRLFGIWNSLKRPEWFEAADSQLMRELKISSRNTIRTCRKQLIEHGFIRSYNPGHRKKTLYQLLDLTDFEVSKNDISKNDISKIDTSRCQKMTPKVSNFDHYIKEKDKKRSTTTTGAAVEFYQNNIRPICSGYELERLQDDISHYGEDTVIKAIQRAVTRNKRSIGYVEGILRRWETDGFDKEGEHGRSSSGYAGSHRRKAPRKDCTDWDDPNADFGGW